MHLFTKSLQYGYCTVHHTHHKHVVADLQHSGSRLLLQYVGYTMQQWAVTHTHFPTIYIKTHVGRILPSELNLIEDFSSKSDYVSEELDPDKEVSKNTCTAATIGIHQEIEVWRSLNENSSTTWWTVYYYTITHAVKTLLASCCKTFNKLCYLLIFNN